MRPRTFKWNRRELVEGDKNHSKNGKSELGFIAQELQEAMDEGDNQILDLVYEANPERLEIKPAGLIPILVKSIQDLNEKLNTMTNQYNSVNIKLKEVTSELNKIKTEMNVSL